MMKETLRQKATRVTIRPDRFIKRVEAAHLRHSQLDLHGKVAEGEMKGEHTPSNRRWSHRLRARECSTLASF